MNELTKHPQLLMIAGVLLVIALVIGAKGSGPTYAVSSGPSAADLKARAEYQAVTDAGLTEARGQIVNGLLTYTKQRDDYQTAVLKIRTDADVTKYQTNAGVTLGLAGLESNERTALDSNRTQRDIAQGEQQVQSQNGILNFFSNIISGIMGFFL